jgi:hypothetical protein
MATCQHRYLLLGGGGDEDASAEEGAEEADTEEAEEARRRRSVADHHRGSGRSGLSAPGLPTPMTPGEWATELIGRKVSV